MTKTTNLDDTAAAAVNDLEVPLLLNNNNNSPRNSCENGECNSEVTTTTTTTTTTKTTVTPADKESTSSCVVQEGNGEQELMSIMDDDDDSNIDDSSWKMLRGRWLLGSVAFLFATLNVCYRMLYDLPGPPSPSVVSMARGYMSFVLFIPLMLMSSGDDPKQPQVPPATTTPSSGDQQQQQDQEQPLLPPLPERQPQQPQSSNASLFWAALEMAVWNFSSQAFFTCGLLTTESARASFLGQTCVVMVPFLSYFDILGGQKRLKPMVWLGCLASFVGLCCLSYDSSAPKNSPIHHHPHHDHHHPDQEETATAPQILWLDEDDEVDHHKSILGVGDWLILAGALTWSLYIIRNSTMANQYNILRLQGLKNGILAIFYTFWVLGSATWNARTTSTSWCDSLWALWPGWKDHSMAWVVLIYSAIGPGTLADVLQQTGQEVVPPTESNLLLSIEPVFTAVLGRFVLGEETSAVEKLGGLFLMGGALIASQ